MKLLILLILGLGLVILFLQNSAPVALVFWGIIKTPSLPLAVWIVLFAVAGILSSLLLQLLSQNPTEVSSNRNYPTDTTPYSNQPPRNPSPEPKKSPTREEYPNASASEWEEDDEEDWDLETPPKEATSPQYPPPKPPENREVEAPQPLPRSPSPYSYVYKQKETVKPPPKKTTNPPGEISRKDQVYDANYRVITPPNQSYNQPAERPLDEDEEWV